MSPTLLFGRGALIPRTGGCKTYMWFWLPPAMNPSLNAGEPFCLGHKKQGLNVDVILARVYPGILIYAVIPRYGSDAFKMITIHFISI